MPRMSFSNRKYYSKIIIIIISVLASLLADVTIVFIIFLASPKAESKNREVSCYRIFNICNIKYKYRPEVKQW